MTMGFKRCIVLGGAGDVGEGIVRQLRHAGHAVCVPSRSTERLELVHQRTGGPGKLFTLNGSVETPVEADDLSRRIEVEFGAADIVVASIGGWWSGGSLLELDLIEWQNILQSHLSSHLFAARAFLPILKNRADAQYVFINGGAAINPVPGSGPISIAAAAQDMMKSVFAKELEAQPVIVSAVMLLSLINTRSREKAQPEWLSADDVGRYLAHLIDNPPENGATLQLQSPQQVEGLLS